MENISTFERTDISTNFVKENIYKKTILDEKASINPMFENIISEFDEDFIQYINWLGLVKENNFLVLSAIHHYYYTIDDFKGIKVLINLKKLNYIKNLGSFLHSIIGLLPLKAYFLGFFNNNNQNQNGFHFHQSVKYFNELINIINSRTDNMISKKDFKGLLKEKGFNVIDFKEINSNTYFCLQKDRRFA